MTSADEYRIKAAELAALSNLDSSLNLQSHYGTMAAAYLRLAEQADRNALTDVAYETPTAQKPIP